MSSFAKVCVMAAMLASGGSALAGMGVTLSSDSVIDSNALLFPAGSTWGRAINGEAFQGNALVSHDGYQYTTWYTNDASRSVMLARRPIAGASAGSWEKVDTGYDLTIGDDAWDVHNVVSLGLSRNDGTLHLSWDHHVHSLKYAKSVSGVATSNKAAWGPGMFSKTANGMLGTVSAGSITYPYFVGTPSGDLTFMYRNGGSGDGDYRISQYKAGAWSTPGLFIGKGGGTYTETYPGGGSYSNLTRNGYPNGLSYGPDGKLHTLWVWREDAAGSNHDINYAYSEDGGVTWKNNAGVQVANTAAGDPMDLSDSGLVVKRLDLRQSLYNTQGQTVDKNGGVHALMWHRRQEPGFEWQSGDTKWEPLDSAYYHYYRDPQTGTWSEQRLPIEATIDGTTRPLPIGRRGQILTDKDGNAFAVYTTRDNPTSEYVYIPGQLVIAGATAASNYTDWSVLHVGQMTFDGEPLVDTERLARDGILSIFMQEGSAVTGVTGSNLHVLEFNVSVPEPSAMGVMAAGATVLLRRRPR